MKVIELFSEARNTLQDLDKNYWDDSELLSYYNECKRSMASERLENKTTATLTLDPLKEVYDTTGILRYISCRDNNDLERKLYPDDGTGDADLDGIIIEDYNRVKVNDPSKGTTLTFKIVAMPEDDNLQNIVRVGDENALRYYIISKAYEKDTDMENFQKSEYFYNKFVMNFKMLKDAANADYRTSAVSTTVSQFY